MKQSRLDVRKFSFSQRTIKVWNKLETEYVHANSVNTSKERVCTGSLLVLTLLACTYSVSNLFHTLMVLWENENFLTSNLLCFITQTSGQLTASDPIRTTHENIAIYCGELPAANCLFFVNKTKDNRTWVADQEPVNMKRLEP